MRSKEDAMIIAVVERVAVFGVFVGLCYLLWHIAKTLDQILAVLQGIRSDTSKKPGD
jgi:hypothetical protein